MKCALILVALLCVVYAEPLVHYESDALASDYELIGRASPDAHVVFRIALKQRNLDILDKAFVAITTPGNAEYQNYLSAKEILTIIAPTVEDLKPVMIWIESSGLNMDYFGGDFIQVSAEAKIVENALNCELHTVRNTKYDQVNIKILPSQGYDLPESVAAQVDFLQRLPRILDITHYSEAPLAASGDMAVPMTSFLQYNISMGTKITTDSSQNVAEFYTNAYLQSDMNSFVKEVLGTEGLSPRTIDNIGSHSKTTGTESTLDIEWITAIGRDGYNFYYTVGNGGWINDLAQDLFAMKDPPLITSISWGAGEAAEGESFNARFDTEAKKLATRGVGLCAASGDSGVGCGFGSTFTPSYPAASPNVLSVGATMFQTGVKTADKSFPPVCFNGQYTCIESGVEVPASIPSINYATGGGFSVFMAQPEWQKKSVEQYLNSASIPKPPASYFKAGNRGYPDVAAVGWNNIIFQNGSPSPVGGTSAASPQWGGIIAILNDHMLKNGKKPLGFVNPLFYMMAQSHPMTFKSDGNLSTNNANGCAYGFTSNPGATPNGWDPVNGLGTGNVGLMINYLDTNMHMFKDL